MKVRARISDGPRAAGGDQPGDPPGDDLRLAGSGAGHDQQRTVTVADRAALLGVESGQQRFDAFRLLRGCGLFGGWPPDRYLLEFVRFARGSLAGLTSHLDRLTRGRDNSRVTGLAWIYRCPGLR